MVVELIVLVWVIYLAFALYFDRKHLDKRFDFLESKFDSKLEIEIVKKMNDIEEEGTESEFEAEEELEVEP